MKKLALILWILGWAAFCQAQDPLVQQTIEDLLESTGESMSDDTDFQEILDDLEGFMQKPLNLNRASSDDLNRLHLLSEVQISNLVRFRKKAGTIHSLTELAAVDGFTPDILEKIGPFVSFDVPGKNAAKKRPANSVLVKSSRVFSHDIQAEQAKYEGSPERLYLRMKHSSGKINYGLVAEKDPGEALFLKSQRQGFDYASAFANFGIGKADNRIFAGDYHVRFGQGLVASQGFSMGKSAETTQVFRSEEGVRSYSSTDENQFFRGLAGKFQFRNFTFYPFVSSHRLDANIDTVNGIPTFGAFQTSGYHRAASEIAGKNAVGQFAGGGHISYSYRRWSFGVTGVYTRFNAVLDRSDEPYNQFLPEGRGSSGVGFDWKGSVKNFFLFGETAFCRNSGRAILTGAVLKPAQNAELAVVYRNVNKTYFSLYSNTFAESSRINDEQGIYLGLKVFPAPHWIFWGYADFFRSQWLKYTTAAPSNGTEFFAQASFCPGRRTTFYLRFFQEDKAQRLIDGIAKYNGQQKISRARLNFIHELNKQFSLKSRFEISMYSKQNCEKGFLILLDLDYQPLKKPFSLNSRLAWFKTDGYNTRLYAFENDLLYSFSVPALYGRGLRAYLNLEYRIAKNFTLWAKFAQTFPFTQSADKVDQNPASKSEFKIQVRYQF